MTEPFAVIILFFPNFYHALFTTVLYVSIGAIIMGGVFMRQGILGGVLLLGSSLVYSSQPVNSNFNSNIRSFAGITAGADFIDTGHSQSVTLLPPFNNHYASDSSYPSSGSLGIGGGVEGHPSERYFWQLGVSGFFNTLATNSGEVWQLGLPEFNNFHYSYNVQTFAWLQQASC
jgi:hypothetical protein